MKPLRFFLLTVMTATLALSSVTYADDGAITNKNMSRTIKLPAFDQDIVNEMLPESEHAFTDMMEFYVPSQAASGLVEPIAYCDIDNNPEPGEDCTNPVEELEVAKPLINVFVHGPQFEVAHTAFAHRWFDTYAAVSLNDGENWKQTNLSGAAHLSSFDIETDHIPSKKDPLPSDHNVLLVSDDGFESLHAKGYDTPVTAHCSECHGQGLQGVAQVVPSCYSCHDNVWTELSGEEIPVESGPVIIQAIWDADNKNKDKGYLEIEGVNAVYKAKVSILNAITGTSVGTTKADFDGGFEFEVQFKDQGVPCVVAAHYTDNNGEDFVGPSLSVIDKETHEPIEDCTGAPVDLTAYPGGSYNVFQATVGNKSLVAWPSRYCQRGQPAYALTTAGENSDADANAMSVDDKNLRLIAIETLIKEGDAELGVTGLGGFKAPRVTADGADLITTGVDDLYLVDAFGVRGNQGSMDFAEEGYPQAGIVPYGCLWTSRGVLLPGDDPRTPNITDENPNPEPAVESSHMVWTKAERLTSGRRDVNRIEVKAVKGVGFVITWQEDPDGIRPGQGLGPGEGWSGAVAHPQTDGWYSFINEEYFDIVETATATAEEEDGVTWDPIAQDILTHDLTLSGRPQVFVPMAVPMRMSNNAKCNAPLTEPSGEPSGEGGEGIPALYCVFTATEEVPVGASVFGLNDQCADTVTVITGPASNPTQQVEKEICVADTNDDGVADLPNRANTGLTRPRTSLQGYDTDADGVADSAWVITAAEESKGLGKYFFEPATDVNGYAIRCEEDSTLTCTEEIGKNQWYFSFDMGTPDTSAGIGNPNSLVENLVSQGNMLNQGEVYWETGELFGLMSTEVMENYDPYNFDILNTEIARRASILVQGVGKAMASANGLAAISSWKQGTMRQGGPADTMLRRFVVPDPFDPAVDNPFAFANMECETFLIPAGENPYYPGGVCADPAINLSGVVPDTCIDDGEGGVSIPCPTVDFDGSTYGIGDTNPILQGYIQKEGNTQRLLTWHQCPSDYTVVASDLTDAVDCATDDRTDDFVNLRDQSWYNPLDVSKGHRGFIDGDFVMFLYGWSPNWRLNAKGNDRYDLYVRRSFDGGKTWATTPTGGLASDGLTPYGGDGTVTCESYRPTVTTPGERVEPTVCYEFAEGANEHARNVTQHRSMNITTLDPRMAKTGGPTGVPITETCTDGLFVDPTVITDIFTCDDLSPEMDSDARDPSRYFMVFEVGDSSTVEIGEAEPLDLFYARAESFGDDYVVWTETDSETADPTLCYPNDPHGDEFVIDTVVDGSGFCNEFNNMNTGGDSHSSEANLVSNPGGTKLYGVWTQWVFAYDDDYESEIVESEAMARRIWWIDDYVSDNPELIYTLPGTQQPDTASPDPQQ